MSNKRTSPSMPFLHLKTNDNGKSIIEESSITDFVEKSIGGKADPQWLKNFEGELSAVKLTILPVGWIGDWHESPKPQWVIATKGRWFIETQDGKRTEMGPGDIHFGEDQNTASIDGNKGHKSGTIGDEDCCLILVQFDRVSDKNFNT